MNKRFLLTGPSVTGLRGLTGRLFGILVLGFLLDSNAALALQSAQEVDLLIRGGRIVDGTGNPSVVGDIGIRGKQIVAMGHLGTTVAAKRIIEAAGLTVSPGFIDIHN